MTSTLVTPPAGLPLSLADLKAHLRIETGDEDDYLTSLLSAATAHVEAVTGKALLAQTWRIYLDAVPADCVVGIAQGPLISLDAVTVYDRDGQPVVVDPQDYDVDRYSEPARLSFREAPTPGQTFNGIEIDITIGYGESGTDIPGQLLRAVMVICAHWHALRGAAEEAAIFGSLPKGLDALLAPFRQVRL